MTREKAVSRVIELKGFTRERLEGEARKSAEALRQEQERLDALEKAYQEHVAEFTSRQNAGTIKAQELDLFYTYFKHLTEQIQKQKHTVQRCQIEHDCFLKALVDAFREQRVFEVFHDKLLREQAREAGAAEQKESDERYLQRRQGR